MKNIFRLLPYVFIFFLLCCSLNSCVNKKDEVNNRITVEGQVLNYPNDSAAFIYESYQLFQNNETTEVDVSPDGSFKMVMKNNAPLKGFFSFGKEPVTIKYEITTVDGRDSAMQISTFDNKMVYLYLEPGDSLVMNLDTENIKESLNFEGTGAQNNVFVNEEENRFNDYKHKYLGNFYNITYRDPADYKSTVDKLYREKVAYLMQFDEEQSISEKLKQLYLTKYKYQTVNRKIAYPGSHSMYNDGKEITLPTDYYDFVEEIEFADEIGDQGIGYYYYMNSALKTMYDRESPAMGFYDYVKSRLQEKAYYEFLALSLGRDFKSELYDQFGDDCPFPEIARMVKDKYRDLEGMLEGSPAPDFTLTDINGDKVSLSDLKGKYVYIDFWATWCGPCKDELPYLKKIEAQYEDRNIHFVSISFDSEKDYDKWKTFVIENELGGIQLFADPSTHDLLSKAFNIQLIPRFVLLDQEGKVVNANAPRPSDKKLISIFEDLGV